VSKRTVLIMLMLMFILLPSLSIVLYIFAPSSGSQTSEEYVNLTLPFRVGDYVALFVENRIVLTNTSLYLGNVTQELVVVDANWSFTTVKTVDGNSSFTIPTFLIALPKGINDSFSAPFYVPYFNEYICMPFKYTDESSGVVVYSSSSPESCSSVLIDLYYDKKTGILNSGSALITIGDNVYGVRYSVLSISRSGDTVVKFYPSKSVCKGYLSSDLLYTAPGAYFVANGSATYTYSDVNSTLSYQYVLLIMKNSENQVLWDFVLSGKFHGWVIVVSPLLKNFQSIPYIDDLMNYGAVLKIGEDKVAGVENILKVLKA